MSRVIYRSGQTFKTTTLDTELTTLILNNQQFEIVLIITCTLAFYLRTSTRLLKYRPLFLRE